MFSFGNSHPIVARDFCVSRAPQHYTPPRFSKSSWDRCYLFHTLTLWEFAILNDASGIIIIFIIYLIFMKSK